MKENNLGTEEIGKLLRIFAIPCVISMLINSVYNIVDQIFIGQGVGTLGNAATNVVFPLVIIFNALAGLVGNGASANLSLKLGEGKKEEGQKSVGQAILLSAIISIIISLISYLLLPKLVYWFGCTKNVYPYALDYGRIIILGAPFMMIYSSLSSIIRADGSPKYSMTLLVIGAILNIILDPIFIFCFHMGVKGGAIATVIGQIVSFGIAMAYIPHMKSVHPTKEDYKLDKNIFKILGLGLSSFITQATVLALFVFMNNMMTKLGASTKFGSDIPLSVYGVTSKINSLFISTVLGISIGAQPIIGFNYGAGKKSRVKETLKKVLILNFIVGILFNIIFFFFGREVVSIFISRDDVNYPLFLEFAEIICHSLLLVCSLNSLEMTTSIVVQSLGNIKKATAVSFIRQIILFIPLACFLGIGLKKGIYGVLYAGALADFICFIICIFVFKSEYKKLEETKVVEETVEQTNKNSYKGKKIVITIAREYGSGGRYVGQILSQNTGIPFYDKNLIHLTAKESGLSNDYIEQTEETKTASYENNNDDLLFLAETKVIQDLAKNSCILVGRCADYILKDEKNVLKVFLYSDDEHKKKRVIEYYHLPENIALKEVRKVNKARQKHYKYYTNHNWNDFNNYDICLNVDTYGVEETAKILEKIIESRN